MKEIYFVTTNPVKFAVGAKKAEPFAIEFIQKKLETPEIQSMDVQEVAEYSARFAADQLQAPVIATDSGLHINALNGFPGPFIKYTNKWFSSQDYLNLMKDKEDRSILWLEAISYCEPGKAPITFMNKAKGSLSTTAYGDMPGRVIQEIFIPEGKDKVGALLSEEELLAFWDQQVIAWDELFAHLEQEQKIKKK